MMAKIFSLTVERTGSIRKKASFFGFIFSYFLADLSGQGTLVTCVGIHVVLR